MLLCRSIMITKLPSSLHARRINTQLDLEHLHGSSRELADAVNHIGEGIRKAVKTSMKDEQPALKRRTRLYQSRLTLRLTYTP